MEITTQLVESLLKERKICFSFCTSPSRVSMEGVSVMICDEHDMAEYDVEFEPDTFVDIGPVHDLSACIPTNLVFASYAEAGSWLAAALVQRQTPNNSFKRTPNGAA